MVAWYLFSVPDRTIFGLRRVPLISNVSDTIRPTLGLDMIRVAFQGNSIATRTGINGVEEIIIQTKAIGNAAIPTDENGRVWIYYGESDSIWNPRVW